MNNRNIIFPSLVIVLSALILVVIGQFEQPRFQDASVDASFFPTVIAIAQIVICIVLMVQYWMKSKRESEAPLFSKMSIFGVLFLFGYALLISFVGYLIASLAAFTFYLVYLKIKKPSYYLIAWAFVVGIYYLFGEVLYISLPQGSIF